MTNAKEAEHSLVLGSCVVVDTKFTASLLHQEVRGCQKHPWDLGHK